MKLRTYQVWLAVMMLVLGGGSLLPGVIIALSPLDTAAPMLAAPALVAEWTSFALGGLLVLCGLVSLGAAMAGTSHVTCPHCGKDATVEIGFVSGRPELRRAERP